MIRLSGAPVIELLAHFPMNGAWYADIHCMATQSFSEGTIVTLSLPEQDFVGRVDRSSLYAERVHVRVVGGTVDWQKSVTALNYAKVQTSQILSDIGVSTDQTVSGSLSYWSRSVGTIGQAVQQLARNLGFNWRINPDGTVRMRAESTVTVDPDAIETWRDESRGIVELAIEKCTVVPGVKVKDDLIGDVNYILQGDGRLSCKYWIGGRGNSVEKYVRWVTRDSIYLGMYTAKVERQASDGTLDLTPEDERLRGTGLQGVEIRHGLPGCSVKVAPGERVLLGFDRGDQSKPFAALWASGSVLEIQLGGALPVAIAQKVDSAVATIIAAFNSHTHVTACPAGAGTAAPTVAPVAPQLPSASLILKTS